MIYNFITDENLKVLLQNDIRSQTISDNTALLINAEKFAIKQMKSRLYLRYDISKIFPIIKNWIADISYLIGDYVCFGDIIYLCKNNHLSTSNPLIDETNWEASDPRDEYLVMICCDITIYHILTRIRPDDIGELREKRYKDAIKWLDDVMKLIQNPDLPILLDDENQDVNMFLFSGSNPKLDHIY